MAAPVQNFTDPTGFVRMSFFNTSFMRFDTPFLIKPLIDRHTEVLTFGLVGRIPYFTRMTDIKINTIKTDIPKPPVGKMLINTFPPIYKERVNYTGLRDTPRQFPPIFLHHSTS